jgi:ribosome-binding protein aMBF1 (putative translation factor)
MSITGAQIREARQLLDWQPRDLAKRAKVQISTIERAEASEGEPVITIAHRNAIQSVLESAGIELIPENGGGPEVRLRKQTSA